jgi:PAP2 superfamily
VSKAGFELNPTFCFTLLGTCAVYLWTLPRRRSVLLVLLLAAILRIGCLMAMGGFGTYFGVAIISWGAFLGIASLIVLSAEIVQTKSSERRFLLRTFYGGAAFPLLALLVGYSIPLNLWLRPMTYDAFLLAFDATLGFQPSFLLGRLLLNSLLWNLTTIIYYALPLSGMLLYASYRLRKTQPVAILQLLLSFMVIGFALYGVYPAVGPNHIFATIYPNHPPALSSISLQPLPEPSSPRNCVPSLHFGAALLVFWNSRIWPRWGRLASGLFLLLTGFATLALGEHYLADLVIALPFALLFQAIWTTALPLRAKERKQAILVGAVLTILWYVLLWRGIPLFIKWPGLSWACILMTTGIVIAFEKKLADAAWAPDTLLVCHSVEQSDEKSAVPRQRQKAVSSLHPE